MDFTRFALGSVEGCQRSPPGWQGSWTFPQTRLASPDLDSADNGA